MAHQSDSLAMRRYSGTLSAFLRANKTGWHSFGYFSFAIERKVTRLAGRIPQGQIKSKD